MTGCRDCAAIAEELFKASSQAARCSAARPEERGSLEESQMAAESARLWLVRALRAKATHETETGHRVPRWDH